MQPHLKRLLNIPDELEVYDMLAFGYPVYEPLPRFVKEKEELLHSGLYDRAKLKTAAEVKESVVSQRRWRAKDFSRQTKKP